MELHARKVIEEKKLAECDVEIDGLLGLFPIVINLFSLLWRAGIIMVRGMPFPRQWPNIMVMDKIKYHFCNNIVGDFGRSVSMGEQCHSYRSHANECCKNNDEMSKIKCGG